MTFIEPPLASRGPRPPEDLDALLRAFFQAQMPQPWPAPPPSGTALRPAASNGVTLPFRAPERPASRPTGPALYKPTRGWSLFRTRLALAASVALLALGAFCLPAAFRDGGAKSVPPAVKHDGADSRFRDPDAQPPAPPRVKEDPGNLKVEEFLDQEPAGTTLKVKAEYVPVKPK